jgi:hypothetical protein
MGDRDLVKRVAHDQSLCRKEPVGLVPSSLTS